MKLFQALRKTDKKKKRTGLADFLLNASDKEKKRVFTEAAKRANKDQRALTK